MAESNLHEESFSLKDIPRSVLVAISGLILLLGLSVYLLVGFIDSERQRDLRTWQTRLGIIANNHFATVEDWIDRQFSDLTGLASNASLQLYAQRLQSKDEDLPMPADVAAVEGVYLKNLFEVSATRGGFTGPMIGPDVRANVRRVGIAGLALLDMSGQPLIATSTMPPLSGRLADEIARLPKAERGLIDIHLGVAGTPTMGFVVPVFAVHGESSASDQIGSIVGVKEVGKGLYPLLRQRGSTYETAEAMLVRPAADNAVEYLSPLRDGTPPLKLHLAAEAGYLAAAFAIDSPGSFAGRQDYRNHTVFVVGRKLAALPWTLAYKIDQAEALSASDARLKRIKGFGLLLIMFVLVVLIGVFRWASSIKVKRSLVELQESLTRNQNLAIFLRVLTDSQPAEIFAVTGEGKYTFANRAAVDNAGMDAEDIMGKDMFNVVGPVKAKAFAKVNEQVIEAQEPQFRTYGFESADGEKTYRVSHLPLRGDPDHPPGVLMVVDDVTGLFSERKRREKSMRQLARTLVTFIDEKDPYSMLHTVFVVEAALGIAGELDLSDADVATVDFTALTVNLGKVFVPREILLKQTDLNEQEHEAIAESQLASAELLGGVAFDLPVREALSQVWEHWDGSGRPQGLRGNEIVIAARVVAVAHAFVGMVSQRAYRDSIAFGQASEMIIAEADRKYDRRVVMALTHYLENRGGKDILERLATMEKHDILSQLSIFRAIDG